jgi:hypothetical protein
MKPAMAVDAAFVGAWEAALAAYSETLDEHRSILQAMELEAAEVAWELQSPTEFVPPEHLPPMPDALLPWARQLLEQTGGLVQLAAELAARSERAMSARGPNARHRLGAADTAASTWDTLL